MKNEEITWKRPEDIEIIRTSNPDEMRGRYLVKRVTKVWTEDFVDQCTGEMVSVDRRQLMMDVGKMTEERVQEAMFLIQSGDIDGVDVCDENMLELTVGTAGSTNPNIYNVEISRFLDRINYIVYAQSIQQAIKIATEFGQVYNGLNGCVTIGNVTLVKAFIVPDNCWCIPEDERSIGELGNEYFKVQVRTSWVEDFKLKKFDSDYIIHANDVGEAKDRISALINCREELYKISGDEAEEGMTKVIRKAAPYKVDCIVPREYSDMYFNK